VLSTGIKQVPGYWVFNAMVSRPVTDRLELQANVYNLLNRYYIDQPTSKPSDSRRGLECADWSNVPLLAVCDEAGRQCGFLRFIVVITKFYATQ